MEYPLRRDNILSLTRFTSCGFSHTVLYIGDSVCTWVLKKCFKGIISQAYEKGITLDSHTKLAIGDLTDPVYGLRH